MKDEKLDYRDRQGNETCLPVEKEKRRRLAAQSAGHSGGGDFSRGLKFSFTLTRSISYFSRSMAILFNNHLCKNDTFFRWALGHINYL